MGLASRGGTPLQDLDLRRIQGVPGQSLDPGLNPGEFLFTSSSSWRVRCLWIIMDYCVRGELKCTAAQFCYQGSLVMVHTQRGMCGFRI